MSLADDLDPVEARAVASGPAVGAAVRLLLSQGIVTKLIAVLAGLVTYRLLDPQGFGKATLALAITSVGIFLLDSGLGAGLVRRKEEPTTEEMRALFTVQLCLAVAVLVLLLGLAMVSTVLQLAAVMALALPFLAVRGPRKFDWSATWTSLPSREWLLPKLSPCKSRSSCCWSWVPDPGAWLGVR